MNRLWITKIASKGSYTGTYKITMKCRNKLKSETTATVNDEPLALSIAMDINATLLLSSGVTIQVLKYG
jgi:hypothetical protein